MQSKQISKPQAIHGKKKFLFLSHDSNGIKEQIAQQTPIPEVQLDYWRESLQYRIDFCRKHADAAYYLFIAPNKHCVYRELLPDDYVVSNKRIACELQKMSENVFYPIGVLRKQKEKKLQYYRTDSHWNTVGCANAWNTFSRIAELNYTIDTSKTKPITLCGDLGVKLVPQVESRSPHIEHMPTANLVWTNFLHNRGHISIFKNFHPDAAKRKRALLFGDSFSAMHIQYIADYFSELYFLHTPGFGEDVIRSIRPDIVITANVERYMAFPGQTYENMLNTQFVSFFDLLKYSRAALKKFVDVPPFEPYFGDVIRHMQQISRKCLDLYQNEQQLSQARMAMSGDNEQLVEAWLSDGTSELPVAHIHHAVSRHYETKNNFKMAYRSIQHAIRCSPDTATYWYERGRILQKQRKSRRAARSINRAIELDKYNCHYWTQLGNIYLFMRKPENSLSCFKQAVSLNPTLELVQHQISGVYMRMGQYKEAVHHSTIACELNPNNPEFRIRLNDAIARESK
ncbi:MAG: hypothetical protein JXX29_02540 [Deltaproteobacteria bacterium]|nr:hypothetical protein [Deltaproteobacteria bacterium]MBN2670519.1 hypothetical protein [Deltaproteobacteria bacterium]